MGKFCVNCGIELSYDDRFCPSCGTAVEEQVSAKGAVATGQELGEQVNNVVSTISANAAPYVQQAGVQVNKAFSSASSAISQGFNEARERINYASDSAPERRDFVKMLLLSIGTLGIYSIYWQYLFVKDLKKVAGDDAIRGYVSALIITIVTFGIYSLYYLYAMSEAVNKAQNLRGIPGERMNSGLYLLICFIPLGGLFYWERLIREFNKVVDSIH